MTGDRRQTAYLVTGTTRGIGKALAAEVAARGQRLFTLSRAPEGPVAGGHNYACDLRYSDRIDQAMARLLDAVAPGVVATDMQAEIRGADNADFPNRDRFVQFQESGQLLSPESVAATLLDLDAGGQLVAGGLYDLRDVVREGNTAVIAPRATTGSRSGDG